jgi:protein TonB
MKNLLLFIFLFFSSISFAQKTNSKSTDAPLTIAEQMPSYKGGEQAMMKFIQQNIKYPEAERIAGISGTCYITFVVEKSGKLSSIRVLRGVEGGKGCDKEAIRVISKMPKWNPGKQNGRFVRVQFNLPIKYTLK